MTGDSGIGPRNVLTWVVACRPCGACGVRRQAGPLTSDPWSRLGCAGQFAVWFGGGKGTASHLRAFLICKIAPWNHLCFSFFDDTFTFYIGEKQSKQQPQNQKYWRRTYCFNSLASIHKLIYAYIQNLSSHLMLVLRKMPVFMKKSQLNKTMKSRQGDLFLNKWVLSF